MYKVSNRYKELRYSGDNDNQLYLEYNNTLVENAPLKTERLKWTRRILDNGSKTLTLDNFVSQTIELTIRDYEVSDTSKEFYIKIGSMVDGAYEYVPLGYYHIKDNPSTANGKTTYKLTDRSTRFDKYIDLSEFIKQNGGKITKLQAVQEYCRQCGVIFANTSFLGSNEEIGVYDNTITARVHITYLAECSSCIAIIGRDGKLYFIPLVKPNASNTHTIPEKILNNNMNNSKGSFKISKVVWEGALMPFEKGDDTGDTLFLNTSNPYISKQEDIDRIYNQVVGLEIDNISTSSIIGDPSIDPWDYIQYKHTFDDGSVRETFTSLAQYDMEFNGAFKQIFDTSIDREKKKINSTVNSPTTKINRIKQEIDTVNGTLKVTSEKVDENTSKIGSLEISNKEITTRVEEVETQTIDTSNPNSTTNKVSKLTQRVDTLESEVKNVTGMTTTKESPTAKITFEDDINTSEPIAIKVYPVGENISNLLISSNMLISDKFKLKQRIVRFTNTTTNENFDYELPNDLLYFNNEIYDEFYLSLDSQTCQITKRCSYNANGSVSKLSSERIEKYTYPFIQLSEGKYTISLRDYSIGYLYVTLMAKNMYTDQFYTKVETDSKFTQTSESINLSVDKKLSNYSTTDEMNASISITANSINQEVSKKVGKDEIKSAINQSPEAVKINAQNVDLAGFVTITDLSGQGTTTIDGSNIKTGTISANRLDSKVITTENFNAQKINANNITSGTINGSNVNVTNINASNITGGTLSCDRLDGGTIKGQKISSGSITGASVSTGYFSVNSKGALKYYRNPGFLVCATGGSTYHPYVSSLNIAYSGGNVLSFRSGTTYSDSGSEVAYITTDKEGDDYNLNLQAHHGAVQLISNAYMYLYSKIDLVASGTAGVWATGSGLSSGRILTDSGSASSKCLKENFKEFTDEDYNSALKLLKNMKLQEYDYKYNMYKDKHQYGFVIDELEENEDCNKWFKFTDNYAKVDGDKLDASVIDDKNFDKEADNVLHYKNYDSNVLDKYLLTCIKALQEKIDTLEEEIKKLKENDKNEKN